MPDDRQSLPLDAIAAAEDNPRAGWAKDTPARRHLAAAIGHPGLLQPLLVLPADEHGRHRLVAGHRRLAAARRAGLEEVPVHVRELTGGALAAAIVENAVREDLSPLEEAQAIKRLQAEQGLTQPRAAKLLGRSERWVRDRLRLLRLPEPVRAGMEQGAIPLTAAPNLDRVAKVAPQVAEEVARQVRAGELDRRLLEDERDFADAVAEIAFEDPCRRTPRQDGGVVMLRCGLHGHGHKSYDLDALPIHQALKDELGPRWRALEPEYAWRSDPPGFVFDEHDAEAAREAGCLLELERRAYGDRTYTEAFITDADFIAERVREKLPKMERASTRRRKQRAEEATQRGVGPDGEPTAAEQERRRQERAEEKRRRVEAHEANVELGRLLEEKVARPDLTADVARLFALLALDEARALGARGLRYVDERHHELVEKRGGARVEYASAEAIERQLWEDLDRATAPEEILGVALRALMAAQLASQDAVAQSNRVWHEVGGYYGSRVAPEARALLERIAHGLGAVPERMVADLERRARERQEEDALLATPDPELAELAVEVVGGAGAGGDRRRVCEAANAHHGRDWEQDEADVVLAAAEEFGWIVERDGGFHVTNAGRAQMGWELEEAETGNLAAAGGEA